MRLVLLALLAGILPLLWGWSIHLLFQRLWPERTASPDPDRDVEPASTTPVDFQI
jgi:hypothetical protein